MLCIAWSWVHVFNVYTAMRLRFGFGYDPAPALSLAGYPNVFFCCVFHVDEFCPVRPVYTSSPFAEISLQSQNCWFLAAGMLRSQTCRTDGSVSTQWLTGTSVQSLESINITLEMKSRLVVLLNLQGVHLSSTLVSSSWMINGCDSNLIRSSATSEVSKSNQKEEDPGLLSSLSS